MSDEPSNFDSTAYWRWRYDAGHNSGAGSYGKLAEYKAEYINELARREQIRTIVELGSGDGNQAAMFEFENYLGLDVSMAVVKHCRERFAERSGWQFEQYESEKRFGTFDMAMSLDVLFHLIEDNVFKDYLSSLFDHADKFVLIYSSNWDELGAEHVQHRNFTPIVADRFPAWRLIDNPEHPHGPKPGEHWTATSPCRFYLYGRALDQDIRFEPRPS